MINEKIKKYDLYSYGAVETEEQLKKAVFVSLIGLKNMNSLLNIKKMPSMTN